MNTNAQEVDARKRFRKLTLELVPPHWSMLRGWLFKSIDHAPDEVLEALLTKLQEIVS